MIRHGGWLSPDAPGQADQVAALLRDTFDKTTETGSQTYVRGLVAGLIGAKISLDKGVGGDLDQTLTVREITRFLDLGTALYLDVAESLGLDPTDVLPG